MARLLQQVQRGSSVHQGITLAEAENLSKSSCCTQDWIGLQKKISLLSLHVKVWQHS